jgi:hypothetical protein
MSSSIVKDHITRDYISQPPLGLVSHVMSYSQWNVSGMVVLSQPAPGFLCSAVFQVSSGRDLFFMSLT